MTYQPKQSVIDQLHAVEFVAVVGPTAVGKTTLIDAVVAADPHVRMLVVHTDRAQRQGEVDGVDYHFRTTAEMQRRITAREYVQVSPFLLGALYATAPEDYYSDGPLFMAVVAAAMPDFRALPFASFRSVFVLPPSFAEWQKRLQTRNFTPEALAKRTVEARLSLKFALQDPDVQFLVNDKKQQAAKELSRLAYGGEAIIDQREGRHIAAELLRQITTTAS